MPNSVETMTDPRSALPNTFTDITAREIDFVTRFQRNWEALREIMGVVRPIEKQAGTQLRSYKASVTLESGAVPAGAVIPYSKSSVVESQYEDLTLEKYAKAVTVEDVLKYGAEVAIEKTDDAFLNELQDTITDRFYNTVKNNQDAMTGAYDSFQMAVAMSIGMVKDKFKQMKRNVTKIVTWVNTLDAYEYLGAATLSLQTSFGVDYVENFMGATLILSSEIERGKVISTPSDNLVLYYANPASADFKKLGLNFTVEGETPLLGFHANGNYTTAVGESFALCGMVLFYEYSDGMAIVDVDSNFLTDLTVKADADDATYPWTSLTPADFQNDVAVAGGKITGSLKFIEGGLAPSGYLSGDGYFVALKFSDFASGLTYANVQVGLKPTQGAGMQTLDSDCNAVFKVMGNKQKLETIQTDPVTGKKNIQYFEFDFDYEDQEGV